IAPIIAALYGYLPARKLRFGSDDETRGSLQQTIDWLTPSPWIDPKDGFDYGQAITRVSLPPTLFIAATHDPTLGHPEDVKRFMAEHGIQPQELLLLSRQHGNLHNYDHITMLTHPDAPNDHFQYVLRWLREHQKQKLGLPLKKGNGKPAF
ncbi:MAG: esterase, partial [Methanobacteriota archaeon]